MLNWLLLFIPAAVHRQHCPMLGTALAKGIKHNVQAYNSIVTRHPVAGDDALGL
jgi:hypothetical protein